MKFLTFILALSIAISAASSVRAQDAVTDKNEQSPIKLKKVAIRKFPSVMFPKPDMRNLEKVLRYRNNQQIDLSDLSSLGDGDNDVMREIARRVQKRQEQVKQIEEEEQKKIVSEDTLPDLYLTSMIYRSDTNWKIWLKKYNFSQTEVINAASSLPSDLLEDGLGQADSAMRANQNNGPGEVTVIESMPQDMEEYELSAQEPSADGGRITVQSIDETQVTLSYKPDAAQAAYKRYKRTDNDSVQLEKFRNRLVIGREVTLNEEERLYIATLNPNQTFSLNQMAIVEGRTVAKGFQDKKLLSQMADENMTSPLMMNDRSGVSMERQISDDLIRSYQKINSLVPQRNLEEGL